MQILEDWSVTNVNILTGRVDGAKVWTAPIVSKDKRDKLTDKLGNEYQLGLMHTSTTDLTPKDRADRFARDAVIARYLFLSKIPEEGQDASSA